MQCPQCDMAVEDDASTCPGCGTRFDGPARRRRRVHAGFALALTALFLLVFAAAVLRPATPTTPPTVSVVPTASVEPTAPPVDPDRLAIEETIRGFYATIDAGGPITGSPFVYRKGRGGVLPKTIESTGTTTFAIARAVVGSATADVYGRESRDVIAKDRAEVEFRLRLIDGTWLISSWQVARETRLAPQALVLSNMTSRDVVGTLLQARRIGDATTVELLTTERFRLAHPSWLDGMDRSAMLVDYEILGTKPQGKTFVVTVHENWKPTPLDAIYTVVMSDGQILVDAWASK